MSRFSPTVLPAAVNPLAEAIMQLSDSYRRSSREAEERRRDQRLEQEQAEDREWQRLQRDIALREKDYRYDLPDDPGPPADPNSALFQGKPLSRQPGGRLYREPESADSLADLVDGLLPTRAAAQFSGSGEEPGASTGGPTPPPGLVSPETRREVLRPVGRTPGLADLVEGMGETGEGTKLRYAPGAFVPGMGVFADRPIFAGQPIGLQRPYQPPPYTPVADQYEEVGTYGDRTVYRTKPEIERAERIRRRAEMLGQVLDPAEAQAFADVYEEDPQLARFTVEQGERRRSRSINAAAFDRITSTYPEFAEYAFDSDVDWRALEREAQQAAVEERELVEAGYSEQDAHLQAWHSVNPQLYRRRGATPIPGSQQSREVRPTSAQQQKARHFVFEYLKNHGGDAIKALEEFDRQIEMDGGDLDPVEQLARDELVKNAIAALGKDTGGLPPWAGRR